MTLNAPLKVLLLSALGFGVYRAMRLASLKKAILNVISIDFKSVSKVVINISVENTTNLEVEINKLNLDLFFDGVKFGVVDFERNIVLSPKNKAFIALPVSVDRFSGLVIASNIILKKGNPVVNISGNIVADGLSFPIKTSYKLW